MRAPLTFFRPSVRWRGGARTFLSAVVKANAVLTSILLFSVIYLLLFAVFVYLLNHKIRHGPEAADLVPSGKLALPKREAT